MQTVTFLTALVGAVSVAALPVEDATLVARFDNAVVAFVTAQYKGHAAAFNVNYNTCYNLGSDEANQMSSVSLGGHEGCQFYIGQNCKGGEFFSATASVPDLSQIKTNLGKSPNDRVNSFLCIPIN